MKAIYLDCFAGISGNMLLGAFIQAGVPEAYLREELKKLPIGGEYALHIDTVQKNGVHAVYVDVELLRHAHHHGEEEGHHAHPHEHRTMKAIRAMIEGAHLSMAVKQKALAVFEALAKAEGKVHGKPADEVAFHEVGVVDSLIDIVGTAVCLDYLDVERVYVSAVNTGSGYVACAHGKMPVPAPATAELLLGFSAYHAGEPRELTTPTGAAILHAFAEQSADIPSDFETEAIAYGAGTWDLSIPNVLRMYVGTCQKAEKRNFCVLETNIDDMSPQIVGYLYERLLEAGAQDVWTTPIYMKKNRPAILLSVLCEEAHRADCARIIFSESTSIGLRVFPVADRLEADRRTALAATKYGEVSCKVCAWDGRLTNVSAEYEDCRRLAKENGVPLKVVQREALKEICMRLGE